MTTDQKIEKLVREVRIHRMITLSLFLFMVAILVIAATYTGSGSYDTLTVNQLTVREVINFQDANQKDWGSIKTTIHQGLNGQVYISRISGPKKVY